MSKRWQVALAALSVSACAPNPSSPVKVSALVLNGQGAFVPQTVELPTLRDVVGLQGSAANLVGGARIVVDSTDPLLQGNLTDAQLASALIKDSGSVPRASYLQKDDVLWPADFDSWNLVTTYYNFEQAFDYFQQVVNVPSAELSGSTVYYFPEFTLKDESPDPQEDNALFFAPVQAFLVLPFQSLQKVPLSMNPGVIAHEFSHRVFNRRAYDGMSVPTPFIQWQSLLQTPALNLLKSFDEGLADYHAVGASCQTAYGCNPDFLAASFDSSLVTDRDLSASDKCMTEALRTEYQTYNVTQFMAAGVQYKLGTVIASALYHAGESQGAATRVELERAVVAAYADSTPATPGVRELIADNLNTPEGLTLGKLAGAFVQHVTDLPLQVELCNQFMDHLQLSAAELGCPASATGGTSCPALPPPP